MQCLCQQLDFGAVEKVSIYNLQGIEFPMKLKQNEIDLGNVVPGYYFLKVNEKYVARFMVSK